jgi:hypothetical protein
MPKKTIDDYVKGLPPPQRKIVSSLVELVREAAPESAGSIKWAQPVFEQNGPFCYIHSFKNHVTFGFWRGLDITSGKGKMESGGKKMAHMKIRNESEIDNGLFQMWVKEAVHLNQTKGDPTKRS